MRLVLQNSGLWAGGFCHGGAPNHLLPETRGEVLDERKSWQRGI